MDRAEAVKSLGSLAADQWGLVTTAQARAAGVSNVTTGRLVEAGLLEQVSHGVYLVIGAAAPEHMEVRAAWLRLAPGRPAWERAALEDDGGVVSHTTATLLHQVGDIPSPVVELTVPKRRTTREPGVRLRRGVLADVDVTTVDGLPVTTVERTVADLLRDRADGGHIGGVVADAQRKNLIDISHAAELAAPHAAAYGAPADDGRALLAQLLAQVGDRLRDEHAKDEDLAVAMLTGYALHDSADHPDPARKAALAALTDAMEAVSAPLRDQIAEVLARSGARIRAETLIPPIALERLRNAYVPSALRAISEATRTPTAQLAASAPALASLGRNPILSSMLADIVARALPDITESISPGIMLPRLPGASPAHDRRGTAPRRHRLRARRHHHKPDLRDTSHAAKDDASTA